ncbi:MAG: hypothetical protein KA352_03285 [Flavobacteriales bacterium]|nr:hypothetical protein [Flavobacteriales bacterium]
MSAEYLKSAISNKVLHTRILAHDTIQVTTARRTRVVYTPFNGYNGTADVVAAAQAKGADTVACPKGMYISEDAKAHAKRLGISIQTIREFLVQIENEHSVL